MKPAFVFDLDGTLVDTAPDLCFANQMSFSTGKGSGRWSLPKCPLLIGNGVKKLIERGFGRAGIVLDADRLDALYQDFIGVYADHKADLSRPYPGVVETLEALQARQARMAVLTNKPHESAVELLDALDLTRFFPVVFGGGKRSYLKPDGRLFSEVMTELGGGLGVMVGDSLPDVEVAHNAGALAVLVTYGYSSSPVATLGADALIDTFGEVPDAVARLTRS